MTTAIEYALMAGVSYRSNRDPLNRFSIPSGWYEVAGSYRNLPSSGFEAVSFTNGSEIVISFAGTNFADKFADFYYGNIPLAMGSLSDQLREAADYYLQVKALNPGATITLTGHSLGGGLASLLAVMFNEQAFTFDQAPFRASALSYDTVDRFTGERTTRSVAQDLLDYLLGKTANDQPIYSASQLQRLAGFVNALRSAPNGVVPNEGNVTNINVQGEILSNFPVGLFSRIGMQADANNLGNSTTGVSDGDLHSQALLTAFLQSGDLSTSTAADHTLGQVTFKLADLLKMIFDPKLFFNDPLNITADAKENFLERLVKHEAGVQGAIAADAMVTRFTSDMWKLAQDGGLTLKDGSLANPNAHYVSNALIAFAMQKYYEETDQSVGTKQELFSDLADEGGSGSIRFDMAAVSTKFKTAFDANERLTLSDAKGYEQYFKTYLQQSTFTEAERGAIISMLPNLRDWYVQAGAEGMNATDTQNRGAFMLGGAGDDTLTGGTSADLLVGNGGSDNLYGAAGSDVLLGGMDEDTLDGGAGNDSLLGGAGKDSYQFSGKFGLDVVQDTDGQGDLNLGGGAQPLNGGKKIIDSVWESDDKKYRYTQVDGQLIVSLNEALAGGMNGTILVKDWVDGDLGLTLGGSADTPMTGNVITGDFKKKQNSAGTAYILGDGGVNYLNDGSQPGAADLITGGDKADYILGLGGNDALLGRDGNDRIDGGDGTDVIMGGLGRDTLNGGSGRDVIYGSSNGKLTYPTSSEFVPGVTSSSNILAQGFNWDLSSVGFDQDALEKVLLALTIQRDEQFGDDENLIDGGAGEDTIFAGTGSDVVHGGADADQIYGMTGSDVLLGDDGNDRIYGDGPNNPVLIDYTSPEQQSNDVLLGGAGNDTLLGQGGGDVLLGGANDDVLYGDDRDLTNTPVAFQGSDYLDGGAGDDRLFGDGGDDILIGGTGDDALEGGAGQDTYIYNAGDGVDTIDDTRGDKNILRFGQGVNKDNIVLRLGSLMLDLGNGDAVHIANFDQNDVFNSSSISSFEFADDSTLSTAELLARGFDLVGTDQDDTILGTNTTDRISGLAGNDTLQGGMGGDVYLFNRGDGADTIEENGDTTSTDVLQFGAGILPSDVVFRRTLAGELMITLVGTDDQITIKNWYTDAAATNRIEKISFADGTTLTPDHFENLPIHGTQGDDLMAGTVGNDTLVGEGGRDTYFMVYGMGTDTVIDASPEGGIVQLAAGLTTLWSSRQGSNLLLQLDSDNSLLIQDYFGSPAPAWTIQDSAGNIVEPRSLTGTANAESTAQAFQLWGEFVKQIKSEAMQMFQGWTLQADGTYTTGWQVYGAYAYAAVQKDTWQTFYTPVDSAMYGNGFSTVTNSAPTTSFNLWSGPLWTSGVGSIQTVVRKTDDAIVTADEALQITHDESARGWYVMNWTNLSSYSDGFVQNTATYQVVENGILYDVDQTLNRLTTYTYATGSVARLSTTPVEVSTLPNGLTSVVSGSYVLDTVVREVEQIELGSGDQTVYANENTMVVGGTGNASIYNAGLAYLSAGNNLVVNTETAYGGAGNDTLLGGGALAGGAGDDVLIGGVSMDGGQGNDQVFTGAGESVVKISAANSGVDLVGGQGNTAQFLATFYQSMGIENWEARYQAPGMYHVHMSDAGHGYYDEAGVMELFDGWGVTLQEVLDNGWADYLEPLPLPVLVRAPDLALDANAAEYYRLAKVPTIELLANDVQALAGYQSFLPEHKVVFGQGIARDALHLEWGTANASISGEGTATPHATLNISWGESGMVQVLMPHFDDAIGSGVTEFEFADGSRISLADMVALAPPVPNLDPQLEDFAFQQGSGETLLNTSFHDVQFTTSTPADVSIRRDGVDLVLSATGSGDSVRLAAWYENQLAYSKFEARFADGTSWNASFLSAQGLVADGSGGNQTLTGLYGYANTLIAGPNDTLIGGGSGQDTYVFNAGAGTVHVQDGSGTGTIQFGAGITPDQISLGLGSLLLRVGTNGDAIHIDGFDPQNALHSSGISKYRFADGTMLSHEQLVERGFDIYGTSGDDVLSGTNVNDRIYADAGNDTLIGGYGNDTLIAGAGVNTFEFSRWGGHDVIDETAKLGLGGGTDVVMTDQWPAGLLFNKLDGNVVVSIMATGATLTVKNIDAIGRFQWVDGSYAVYETRGVDRARITTYAADGTLLQVANQTFDGTGNATTISYDAEWIETGSHQQAIDGQGNAKVTHYDPAGVRLSDEWTHADGTRGADTFNLDGSSHGYSSNPDGSYSAYQDDGDGTRTDWDYDADETLLRYQTIVTDEYGTITTRRYDADGGFVSETRSWQGQNGAYGTYTDFANGSYESVGYDPEYEDAGFPGAVAYLGRGDGQGHGVEYQYDADGVLLGSFVIEYSLAYWSSTRFDASGRKISDVWSAAEGRGNNTYNVDGTSSGESYSNVDNTRSTYVNDGAGTITTQNFDPMGALVGSTTSTDDGVGNTSITSFNADGVKVSASWAHADGTSGRDTFNADGSVESVVAVTYADGSTYVTDTVTQPDGAYHQSWSMSDGSTGVTDYNATTGETSGSSAMTGTGCTYSFVNTPNAGGVNGATELTETYAYADGSTYNTDTINQPDGSYTRAWSSSDGSHGSDTYHADGSSEGSTYNPQGLYGYFDGAVSSTYSDDGQGQYVSREYVASGTLLGSSIRNWDAAEQRLTYVVYDAGGRRVSESWFDYAGSTWGDVRYEPDGSSSGTSYGADGGYSSFTNDGRNNVHTLIYDAGGQLLSDSWTYSNLAPTAGTIADQGAEQGKAFTFRVPDGSFSDAGDALVYSAAMVDGSPLPSWLSFDPLTQTFGGTPGSADPGPYTVVVTVTDSGGLSASTSFDLTVATGPVTVDSGSGYTYTYQTINLGNGATESKVTYTYADGSTYSTDTVSLADGSYQQAWSKSDGSHGHSNWNAATGETSGDVAQAGAGYSYAYDNTILGGGATESKVTYTYDDGSTYSTDTVSQADGSYQQAWSKSDGSHGHANWSAATGETSGDVAQAGAGYSYAYDNTVLGNGATESRVTYTYADGSTYSTDTVSLADGSYRQSWSKSDGTSGSATVDVAGHLLAGGAGNDVLTAQDGNDVLMGGMGDDTVAGGDGTDLLMGGQGSDTYVLGRGWGADVIMENDATAGNSDVIQLGADVTVDQLWFSHVGNNLELGIIGTTDSYTVKDWYLGSQYHVEQFKTADGKMLLDNQVENLVQAMAAFSPPSSGQMTLPDSYATALNPVLAASWQ